MLIFFHTYIPSPILITVGFVSIYWYGLLLAAALLAGYWLAGFLAKRKNLPVGLIESLYINLVIWGFAGARLYHVLNEWGYYWRNPAEIIMVWHGGLAIHGAIIAGLGALYYSARRRKLVFWSLLDLYSLPLLLGQVIGRWGNYFNQELFGQPTNLPWGIPIDIANRPAGFEQFNYFHPAFLYESLWNLGVFVFLWFLFKKQKRAAGTIFWSYVGLYSLGRFSVELLRIDSVPILFGARLPLAVSALLIILAATMFWRVKRRT